MDDSKVLSPDAREALFDRIRAAGDVAWAAVGPPLLDRINILQATFLAMELAVERLREPPDFALIDGNRLPRFVCEHEAIPGGDASEVAIACASVVAKVVRDRMMAIYDAVYEGYGFARHKGYATRDHVAAILRLGPCPIHRLSFEPVRQLPLFPSP